MDRPLNIGILHYSSPPVVGGVEEVLSQQASILHRLGQSVSILPGMGNVKLWVSPGIAGGLPWIN